MKKLFRLGFLLSGSLFVTHCKSETKNDLGPDSNYNYSLSFKMDINGFYGVFTNTK